MSMALYVHCGYHKTGSSYLQSVLAANRPALAAAGYHYPAGDHAAAAVRGEATSGNGSPVAMAIRRLDAGATRELLTRYRAGAADAGVGAVVLSSEDFFHSFGHRGAMRCLEEAADATGFAAVHGLVFVRDPAEHARSTYVHRAATRILPAFPRWLATEYETPRLLEAFCNDVASSGIVWTVRKYAPDVRPVENVALCEWLGLHAFERPAVATVNPSLTLSDALLTQLMEHHLPGVTPFLRRALKAVPLEHKARNRSLRQAYVRAAGQAARAASGVYWRVNLLLPPEEAVEVPPATPGAAAADANDPPLSLSIDQGEAVANALEQYLDARKLAPRVKTQLKSAVNRLRRAVS